MLTKLGKHLRNLRMDKGELLKTMANKLTISSSYLSSIEHGDRTPPIDLVKQIVDIYQLNEQESIHLEQNYQDSISDMNFNFQFTNTSKQHKELAIAFARKFETLENSEVATILNFFKNNNGGNNNE